MIVSYLLPFFRKASLFRMMLPVNDCFRHPDVEVVCVLDEPSDLIGVLETVSATPDVRFRVLVNDHPHPWRPPCIAYNVGIRQAEAAHVILADPESAIVMPSPDFPRILIEQDFRRCYAGICWNETDIKLGDSPELIRHKIQVCEATDRIWMIAYGCLLAPKIALERVCGLDESRTQYGYDDLDIRARLIRLGNPLLVDAPIKVFHMYHLDTDREKCGSELPGPNIQLTHQRDTWGRDGAFRKVWDWRKD